MRKARRQLGGDPLTQCPSPLPSAIFEVLVCAAWRDTCLIRSHHPRAYNWKSTISHLCLAKAVRVTTLCHRRTALSFRVEAPPRQRVIGRREIVLKGCTDELQGPVSLPRLCRFYRARWVLTERSPVFAIEKCCDFLWITSRYADFDSLPINLKSPRRQLRCGFESRPRHE